MTKLKCGIFGITGCMGCQLNILYQDHLLEILNLIDLRAFPVGKEKNALDEHYDVAFVEGVIVSKEDIAMIEKIRAQSGLLVAIGACATDGCIPGLLNFVDKDKAKSAVYTAEKIPELESVDPAPLEDYVKVDYRIHGCPMDKVEFMQFIKEVVVQGKHFKPDEKSICHQCTLMENGCLLEEGRECLGPITFGNCSVMCPHLNHGCYGCRGPFPDANMRAFYEVLERQGLDKEAIMKRVVKFAGVRFKRMIELQEVHS